MGLTEEKELGMIQSTMLGFEDHGIFSFMIDFDFGGSGQGFGGYALDEPKMDGDKFICRIGSAFGCEVIKRILKAVGVEKWEDLVGKEMWVTREERRGMIRGIEAPKYRKSGGRFNILELVEEMKPK